MEEDKEVRGGRRGEGRKGEKEGSVQNRGRRPMGNSSGSQTSKFQGLPLTLTVYKWNQMDPLGSIWLTDICTLSHTCKGSI